MGAGFGVELDKEVAVISSECSVPEKFSVDLGQGGMVRGDRYPLLRIPGGLEVCIFFPLSRPGAESRGN